MAFSNQPARGRESGFIRHVEAGLLLAEVRVRYLKVCSNDLAELEAWVAQANGGRITPCQRCKPLGD